MNNTTRMTNKNNKNIPDDMNTIGKTRKRFYRIGEVAEILGITKEGVRYLEKQGILSSIRDPENRYRLYQRRGIAEAQQIRAYMSAGIRMKDAKDMIFHDEKSVLLEKLESQKTILQAQIRDLQTKLKLLSMHETMIHEADKYTGREIVRHMNGFYYLPVECGKADDVQNMISRAQENLWMSKQPLTLLAKRPINARGETQLGKGIYADEMALPLLNLSVPPEAIYYPGGLYYVRFIETEVGLETAFEDIFEDAAEKHRVTGDMISVVVMAVCHDGERRLLNMVMVPIDEKDQA